MGRSTSLCMKCDARSTRIKAYRTHGAVSLQTDSTLKYPAAVVLGSRPAPSVDMPKELRLQAARAAVLLLPDENREALRTLLCLLSDVTGSVAENQMTPTNLAVCLAPSLFHLNTLRRKESSSPRCVPSDAVQFCHSAFSFTNRN